jgi:hypothetical protein
LEKIGWEGVADCHRARAVTLWSNLFYVESQYRRSGCGQRGMTWKYQKILCRLPFAVTRADLRSMVNDSPPPHSRHQTNESVKKHDRYDRSDHVFSSRGLACGQQSLLPAWAAQLNVGKTSRLEFGDLLAGEEKQKSASRLRPARRKQKPAHDRCRQIRQGCSRCLSC